MLADGTFHHGEAGANIVMLEGVDEINACYGAEEVKFDEPYPQKNLYCGENHVKQPVGYVILCDGRVFGQAGSFQEWKQTIRVSCSALHGRVLQTHSCCSDY